MHPIEHDPLRAPRWHALTGRLPAARLPRGAVAGLLALSLGLLAWSAPAAQAVPRAGLALPASTTTYKYTFSRIAWTGSAAVIAATDSHGDLYYFSLASSGTTWKKQLVASGGNGFAYSKPSIAWTGTAVLIAATDASGDLVYFTKKPSASTWSSHLLATPSSGKYQAPSATAGDGYVLISAGLSTGELDTFTLAPGGTSWAEQTVASGLFGPSSITTVFDTKSSEYLGLLTASSGGALYFWYEFLAAPGWNEQTVASPGAGTSYTGGSITASPSYIVITAATAAGQVDSFTQPIGGTGWTEAGVSASGGPYASPQITWTGDVNGTSDSYDVITAANKAGALHYWWVPDGVTTAWNPETIAKNSKTATYASPGITATSTSVVITAINTKPGDVMYWHQPFGGTNWTKQVVATG